MVTPQYLGASLSFSTLISIFKVRFSTLNLLYKENNAFFFIQDRKIKHSFSYGLFLY